jgi:hypothetical protein
MTNEIGKGVLVICTLLAFLLSAMFKDVQVTNPALQYAAEACGPNGGLKHLGVDGFGSVEARCNSGVKVSFDTGRIPGEQP